MADLKDTKKGDFVALSVSDGWNSRRTSKAQVTRTTATRIILEERAFSRSGREVGKWSDYRSPRIEAWSDDIHPALIAEERAVRRLEVARRTLNNYNWSGISKEKAEAVLAILGDANG